MTINDRVKEIRESLGLTQEEFGKALSVQKAAVSKIEHGDNGVSPQIIALICSKYNINENWLRTGEGDMNLPDPKEGIDKLATEYGLNADDKAAIREFAALDKDQRAEVLDFARKLADALNEQKKKTEEEKQLHADLQREIDTRDATGGKVSSGSASTGK